MQLKKMALGKFQSWIDGGSAYQLENEPMHVVRRRALAELHRRLKVAQGREEEGAGATEALGLCKELGLLVKSVDETNEDGEPRLVAAGSGGNVWALELLLAAGCEVGSASKKGGWTALHRASMLGHVESVVCLVKAGADVYATVDGKTCLMVAAGAGQSDVVGYLAEKGGKGLVMAVGYGGRSCAHVAASQGRADVLRILFEAGGKELLMLTDDDGESCAAVASGSGHVEALRVLIEAGGKELLMLTDKNGSSCATGASIDGHAGVLRMLFEVGGKELLALTGDEGAAYAACAAANGHVEALRILIELGGKKILMMKGEDGLPCAYLACQNGHTEALRMLIEAGGKELLMLTDDAEGASCAVAASESGHVEVLRMLIEAGGTELLMLTGEDGTSCAYVASQNGYTEALMMLIEAGGKELLMLPNNKGKSCLSAAVLCGHTPAVEFLLERGGRELVVLLSDSEMSCLHFAAAGGDDEVGTALAEMLVTAGGVKLLGQADSRLGWTPLHNAVYAGHSLLVGKMLEWMEPSGDVEEVRQSIEALQEANMGIFRGVPQMAPVDSREGAVEFFDFSTVRSSKGCKAGCKCYYEVTILRVDGSASNIGFATSGFERVRTISDHPSLWGNGVGSDDQSWGVCGIQQRLWHVESGVQHSDEEGEKGGGEEEEEEEDEDEEDEEGEEDWREYEASWQEGDVVGMACDLANGQILVSVNGSFEAPNGVVFERAGGFEGEMFAAISGTTGRLHYNLGATPFAHAPPASDFEAFCSVTAS